MNRLLLIPMFILFVGTGCKKSQPQPPISTPQPPPPPTVINTPPSVSAGANIGLFLPLDSVILSGSATDSENNIDSSVWSQVSGPTQAIIHTPASFKTKISNLVEGEYNFQLAAVDTGNLSGNARVRVLVKDSTVTGTNILILEVVEVTCWGPECTILVDTSYTYIYRNAPIRAFIKPVDLSAWVEIPQQKYRFSSSGEDFWFEWYGLDDRKKYEVLIMY